MAYDEQQRLAPSMPRAIHQQNERLFAGQLRASRNLPRRP